jgi:hypothetical protein
MQQICSELTDDTTRVASSLCHICCESTGNELRAIPGATHLFEERGKLEEVARHASQWFIKYFGH